MGEPLFYKAGPISFFLRVPEFPVICAIQSQVFAATSVQMLAENITSFTLTPGENYDVIAANGEVWDLFTDTDQLIISPWRMRRHWSKLALVKLVNARTNKDPDEKPYSERSLNAKRFEVVFQELVERII